MIRFESVAASAVKLRTRLTYIHWWLSYHCTLTVDSVQVFVRLRPLNAREHEESGERCSLTQLGTTGLHLNVERRNHSFAFDQICGRESTQEELFQRAHLHECRLQAH